MGAAVVEVASGLVTELNSDPLTNFGVTFKAERSYADFDIKLEDIKDQSIRCDVWPVRYPAFEKEGRGTSAADALIAREVSVRVALRKMVGIEDGKATIDKVDELIFALEKLADYTVQRELTDYTAATHLETTIPQAYDDEHLRERGQYTGIVEVTYEVVSVP